MQTNTNANAEAGAALVARNYKTWSSYSGSKLYLIVHRKSGDIVNNTLFTYREIVAFWPFFSSSLYKIEVAK
jgi:hypothetical protein